MATITTSPAGGIAEPKPIASVPSDEQLQQIAQTIRPHLSVKREDFLDLARAIRVHALLKGRTAVVLGYGDMALHLINAFEACGGIAAIAETDPAKHGWSFRGVPVVSVDEAFARRPAVMVVGHEPDNVQWHRTFEFHPGRNDARLVLHPNPDRTKQYWYDLPRHDPLYRSMFARADKPRSMLRPPKLLFLMESLRQSLKLPGDVMELGVYRGGSAWFLGRMLESLAPERDLWLYDLFELMPPEQRDGIMCLDEIRTYMSFYPKAHVIQDDFSKRVGEVRARKHCFIHFDLCFGAEWLDACWASLVPGGCILFDNFGLMDPRNPVKFASWFETRGYPISYAPHQEQAWVIKR
ncbi:MAG: TylF/MycF/NovP-related O-methyltransferase [Phycisphaerales bacterium]|jgi:hypothetical protein|nr:TylF/MycF/NovP-related O-methyltransferase [Phycisphaerales bacterium]